MKRPRISIDVHTCSFHLPSPQIQRLSAFLNTSTMNPSEEGTRNAPVKHDDEEEELTWDGSYPLPEGMVAELKRFADELDAEELNAEDASEEEVNTMEWGPSTWSILSDMCFQQQERRAQERYAAKMEAAHALNEHHRAKPAARDEFFQRPTACHEAFEQRLKEEAAEPSLGNVLVDDSSIRIFNLVNRPQDPSEWNVEDGLL
jgi:hypothetical protein